MLKLAHSQHDLNVRFCSAELNRNLWNTEFHRLASGKTAWWSGKKGKLWPSLCNTAAIHWITASITPQIPRHSKLEEILRTWGSELL